MFQTLIIFLPVSVCLFWMIAHTLSAYRVDTYRIVMVLLLFAGIVLFFDSCYSDNRAPMDLFMVSAIIAQFAAPCLIPLVGLYMRRLRTSERPHPIMMAWLLAPAALFSSEIVMHLLAAPGELHRSLQDYYFGNADMSAYKGTIAYAHYITSVVVFRCVIAFEMLMLLLFRILDAINTKAKFRHLIHFWSGGSIRLKGLQTFNLTLVFILFGIKLILFRSYVNSHPWVMVIMSLLMSVAMSAFCFAALFGARRSITLKDLLNGWRYNYGEADKQEALSRMIEEMVYETDNSTVERLCQRMRALGITPGQKPGAVTPTHVPVFTSHIINLSGGPMEGDSLRARFQRLMLDEQIFLSPRLSLSEVAKRLHSNTTYVSKLVNDTYDLGFPELINTLRVDYAQQYLKRHAHAKQSQIASECGFLSASAFNNTFKRITGMTPKMWIATHRDHEK